MKECSALKEERGTITLKSFNWSHSKALLLLCENPRPAQTCISGLPKYQVLPSASLLNRASQGDSLGS